MTDEWQFNDTVAETFVAHAQQHIPNYNLVIDKCVDLCYYKLLPTAKIIDVGCATGETLRRLHQRGFTNLVGVEASHAMLKHCDSGIAEYHHSDQFPQDSYDAVLCNWTLHFIKDKVAYIKDMYDSVKQNGFLVVSDKTTKDDLPLHFYHDLKARAGVSQEAIDQKAESVKNIMFLDSPEWYLDIFKQVGFSKVYIIDASWCFTTFLCIK